MTVSIRAICPEILGNFPSGNYKLNDGLSAIDAIRQAIELSGTANADIASLDRLVYMRNGKHITKDVILLDGDTLMALRPVYGG